MAAYVVFIRERITDPAEFALYRQKAAAARGDHPLKRLVFDGNLEVLEGESTDGVVILEFPDIAAAHAWYDSPAYQEAKAHRLRGADHRVLLVQGL